MRAAFLTLLLLAAPAAAQLSPAEQRMVRTVDAGRERDVQLLERLVNQNSGTMNLPGVAAVGRVMRAELDALGFTTRLVDQSAVGRAGHLVAVHRGNGRGKRLLLIGHLDTVFEPSSPFQRFVRDGDIATGPGVNDMKGGLVVMLAALRAMRDAGTLRTADIEIVLTGDEERPGRPLDTARADLLAAGRRADAALEFETLSRENGADIGSIARRSSSSWELRVTGKPGHSSGIFGASAGNGAAYEAARILDAFRSELPEPNLTFNVGLLLGGDAVALNEDRTGGSATGKTNIIPRSTIALGDMRTLSEEQTVRVRTKMRAIVARNLPGANAEIAFTDSYPPMPPTAGGRALLAKLNEVNRDLRMPEMAELDPAKRGAGDIAFVAKDVDGLVGTGIAGSGAHAEGETADLASLPRQAQRAAILMTRLSRERR